MRNSKIASPRSPKKKKLPKVIPPRSIFRLDRSDSKTPGWRKDVGRVFRIGYYSQQDGLDVIWLVNEKGEYEQTTDRDFLLKYFEPIEISDESDLYGAEKRKFKPLLGVAQLSHMDYLYDGENLLGGKGQLRQCDCRVPQVSQVLRDLGVTKGVRVARAIAFIPTFEGAPSKPRLGGGFPY